MLLLSSYYCFHCRLQVLLYYFRANSYPIKFIQDALLQFKLLHVKSIYILTQFSFRKDKLTYVKIKNRFVMDKSIAICFDFMKSKVILNSWPQFHSSFDCIVVVFIVKHLQATLSQKV